MRENVRNFVEMVADGKDVMIAADCLNLEQKIRKDVLIVKRNITEKTRQKSNENIVWKS